MCELPTLEEVYSRDFSELPTVAAGAAHLDASVYSDYPAYSDYPPTVKPPFNTLHRTTHAPHLSFSLSLLFLALKQSPPPASDYLAGPGCAKLGRNTARKISTVPTCQESERILIEFMTSDHKLKTSRVCSK